MTQVTKTLSLRIKDKHAKALIAMSCDVNMVWNYINELSYTHTKRTGKFFSGYDIQKYTKGATKDGLNINAATVQMVGHEYATRRKQFNKIKLKWRKSFGTRKSLGWIPFRHDCVSYKNGQVNYCGLKINLWDSYGLSNYELGTGSFSEDSRGRWYFNTTVKVNVKKSCATKSVGIDLGLKECAVTSDGVRLEGRNYRKLEESLGKAQRANKKDLVRAIHAKIKNRRKDELHKFSTMLVNKYGAVFVGNVSSSKLLKTKMAKSTLDAGWSSLKTMLEYKSRQAGVVFEEVNEAYSTQTCSSCGEISPNSPKGMSGLGIREWKCDCGAVHDRDINGAKNILAAGHCRLAGGIPCI